MDAKFTAAAQIALCFALFLPIHRRQIAKQATVRIVIWQQSVYIMFEILC
jgi:hypothetical protein